MDLQLRNLIIEYLNHKKIINEFPNEKFINYLLTFTTERDFSPVSIHTLNKSLQERNAFNLYDQMRDTSDTENKLILFLIKTSDLKKNTRNKIIQCKDEKLDNINKNIKKIALGFDIPLINTANILQLKGNYKHHIYDVIFKILQCGQIYFKLKGLKSGNNRSYSFFIAALKNELSIYENRVISCVEISPIKFHTELYTSFNKLTFLNQLNDFFCDNNKTPYKVLDFFKNNTFVSEITKNCDTFLNKLTNEFINTGRIKANQKEFFITQNANEKDLWISFVIDYGLLPSFISKVCAEKILYIGKCVLLIKNETFNYRLNLRSNSQSDQLDGIITQINPKLRDEFIVKNRFMHYLNQARYIFLLGRSDLAETLIRSLKNTNNMSFTNKNINYILENALYNTLGEVNDFTRGIDICILENESSWNYITLFCMLDFPLNILFTKEIIMKFVSIFKVLWRIKKLEHALKQLKKKEFIDGGQIKIMSYINLIYKINLYMHEEVINKHYLHELDKQMTIDKIRKELNERLDKICYGFFINEDGKTEFDPFYSSLETMVISLSKIKINIVRNEVVNNFLKECVVKNEEKLRMTSLKELYVFYE